MTTTTTTAPTPDPHRPPRPTTATPTPAQLRVGTPDLASFRDGFAAMNNDGEVVVGRSCNSVVFRRRNVSAQPLGRNTPMVPDGRFALLPKEFTFGQANRPDAHHAGSILHGWADAATIAAERGAAGGAAACSGAGAGKRRGGGGGGTATPSRRQRKHQQLLMQQLQQRMRASSAAAARPDPSQLRPAGIASGVATPECRFANAIGSAATPVPSSRADGGSMAALVAHEFRYAWVASKLSEHELSLRRDAARKRADSATPLRRTPAADGDRAAPPSETAAPIASLPSSPTAAAAMAAANGGLVVGPSGRVVSHYPRLVSQRLVAAMAFARPHAKEHFTMQQFRNVPSRYAGRPTQCFAAAAEKREHGCAATS
jgi:hypothetical protein